MLVTGAGGFLGSEIVRYAAAAGARVRAVTRSREPPPVADEHVWADLVDRERLAEATQNMEAVIHTAGLAHQVRTTPDLPARLRIANEIGAANIAEASAVAGVSHFVLISSMSVYGSFQGVPWREDRTCAPDSVYGHSKWQGEKRVIAIAGASGMRLTVLRMATLFGEEDPGNIARLMRAIDRGRFIWVGSGANRKSLVYRGDAARASVSALNRPGDAIAIYNVATICCPIRDVVEGLGRCLGHALPSWRVPAPLAIATSRALARVFSGSTRAAQLHSALAKWDSDAVCDTDRFGDAVGFRGEVDLMEGLRREVAWYRASRR